MESWEGKPCGIGLDFCTATVSTNVGRLLTSRTKLSEPGTPRQGFGRSEERACLGGHVWRRFDPHGASPRFGLEYESWEAASNGPAWWLGRDLRGWPGETKPTRVDVAFDYEVHHDERAEDLAEVLWPVAERKGFGPGANMRQGVWTAYIGSAASNLRIRIYRRDLRDSILLTTMGPTMRVELVLRREAAEGWWVKYIEGEEEGWAAAAAIVLMMTGWRPCGDVGEVPDLVGRPEDLEAGQMLLEFLRQNASMVDACRRAGVDVFRLAGEQLEGATRMTQFRHQKRVEKLQAVGSEGVEAAVRLLREAERKLEATRI